MMEKMKLEKEISRQLANALLEFEKESHKDNKEEAEKLLKIEILEKELGKFNFS